MTFDEQLLTALGRLWGVTPSTVKRWVNGEAAPHPLGQESVLKSLASSMTATVVPREFALRCRPAIAAWVRKCERDEDNTSYPEHYKPVLKEAADKARQLLNEIDEAAGLPVQNHG